jgi:phage terminase large subunit-like protein
VKISKSDLRRVVVAVDPAATSNEDSDDTGIIVVARTLHLVDSKCTLENCPGHGVVLGDYTCHLPPAGWARAALKAYDDWSADRIIAETNNGGEMVGEVIRAQRVGVPYDTVTATRGKTTRAEPISALYDQNRFHHVGEFPELEEQMRTFTQDSTESPDRMDALVWGATYLGLIGGQGMALLQHMKDQTQKQRNPTHAVLETLPKLAHEADHPALRKGCKHRYFGSPESGFHCTNCGGRLVQDEG